jgi:DNA modification methylase
MHMTAEIGAQATLARNKLKGGAGLQAPVHPRRRISVKESLTGVQTMPLDQIKPNPRNPKTHSGKQIRQIADSIVGFGFTNPLLIGERGELIAGHGRYQAAKLLGLTTVPVIIVNGLSRAKRRALAIADNKIAENAGWDRERLAIEIPELTELLSAEGLDISILGFEPVVIDQLQTDFEAESSDPEDSIEPNWLDMPRISQPGDLWVLGNHRLMCADARRADHISKLMKRCRADMAFLDPPFNVRIAGVVGRGRTKHSEFAMASGEMSSPDFVRFLSTALDAAAAVSRDGAVHFVCIDWRHVGELLAAANSVHGAMLNLVVWTKTNAGQGSFYRSAHELIGVFRVGKTTHLNNIELGRHGRSRSNVWHYAGVNSFRAGRMDELRSHPTAKPVALVADAIKDCTRRGDIVLDTFCGSGTTILAAERVGRRGYAMEIEPRYVDVAIRRWQAFTRKDAVHIATCHTFDEMAAERLTSTNSREHPRRGAKRR